MTDIKTIFCALSPKTKKDFHLAACQYSLGQWDKFWKNNDVDMSYVDSVVGMRHEVDFEQLLNAYLAVKNGHYDEKIYQGFLEPITALQDMDWELPDDVQMAYYSIYNLYRKYGRREKIDDWLIINQALSSSPEAMESDFAQKLIRLV